MDILNVFLVETMVSVDKQKNVENLVAAGGNNTDYLQLAKKGGGHHGKIISQNPIFISKFHYYDHQSAKKILFI